MGLAPSMATVMLEKEIPYAGRRDVWLSVVDIASYPEFMPQVLAIDVLQQDSLEEAIVRRSAWTVLFNGSELKWVQQDRIYEDREEIQYEQIEGDLAVWRGRTRLLEGSVGPIVRYEIEFDLGVPALAAMLDPLAERAVRANCEQMLAALVERTRAVGSGLCVSTI